MQPYQITITLFTYLHYIVLGEKIEKWLKNSRNGFYVNFKDFKVILKTLRFSKLMVSFQTTVQSTVTHHTVMLYKTIREI